MSESSSPHAYVLNIAIDVLDMDRATTRLRQMLTDEEKGYVCLAGVHGIMEAQRDSRIAAAFAEAALVLPDGMPTVWVGQFQGHKSMQQITGPDLMLEIMQRDIFRDCTHFFYGGKEGIAEELRDNLTARFPHVKIVGTYTPPFSPLSLEQERDLIETVGALRPDIVWVGISTPKQERFMNTYLSRLDTTLMFGVGAAFDFHTGRIRDCSLWIKRCGMQWFHRMLQDPRHLCKRYLRNNPAFLYALALEAIGLRSLPHPPEVIRAQLPKHPPPHSSQIASHISNRDISATNR
jgi:N-acetylglucosaminyldiphosphoundecaprenol N-acetyl-beta-D-mannosaminyltransferase